MILLVVDHEYGVAGAALGSICDAAVALQPHDGQPLQRPPPNITGTWQDHDGRCRRLAITVIGL